MSVRSDTKASESEVDRPNRRDRTWFIQGFVNKARNPKGTLAYLGVFTMVMTPWTSVADMAVLVVIMMLVSASFWLFFVYTLDRPISRGFIERSQRVVNRAFWGVAGLSRDESGVHGAIDEVLG